LRLCQSMCTAIRIPGRSGCMTTLSIICSMTSRTRRWHPLCSGRRSWATCSFGAMPTRRSSGTGASMENILKYYW